MRSPATFLLLPPTPSRAFPSMCDGRLAPIDCLRGGINSVSRVLEEERGFAAHPESQVEVLRDVLVEKNERLRRSSTLNALRVMDQNTRIREGNVASHALQHDNQLDLPAGVMSQTSREDSPTSDSSKLRVAHAYAVAKLPRRVYATHPETGVRLHDPKSGKPIARLRQTHDQGDVENYHVCCPCTESHRALSDFGTGVALYYKNLLYWIGICLVLFLVNSPVMYCNLTLKLHFTGRNGTNAPVYGPPPDFCGFEKQKVRISMDQKMQSLNASDGTVPWADQFSQRLLLDYAEISHPVTFLQVATAAATSFLLIIVVMVSVSLENSERRKIDERHYSVGDYSIEVKGTNLPTDPLIYKNFYEQRILGTKVMRVSVIYPERRLLKALTTFLRAERHATVSFVEERAISRRSSFTGQAIQWSSWAAHWLGCRRTSKDWMKVRMQALQRIKAENERIEKSRSRSCKPSRVFITFETEVGKHRCLREMAGDWWDRYQLRRNVSADDPPFDRIEACMHGEAPEPSDIAWDSLDASYCAVLGRQLLSWLLSTLVCYILFLILLEVSIVDESSRDQSTTKRGALQAYGPAVAVAAINVFLPNIMKFLCRVEIHSRESHRQASMMVKLLIVRFMNSAILTFLVSKKSGFLGTTMSSKIQNIMLLDVFLPALLRMLDAYNLFMRYIVAPKAATQALMNQHFNGTYWNLAERYTDMMKKLFVCLFYVSLVPSGLLITAAAFTIDYFTDKYLLLRRWRVPGHIGAHLSVGARVFFYLTVLASMVMNIWYFRHWPFSCDMLSFPSAPSTYNCTTDIQAFIVDSEPVFAWPVDAPTTVSGIYVLGVLTGVISLIIVSHTLGIGAAEVLRRTCCTKSRIMPERQARRAGNHSRNLHRAMVKHEQGIPYSFLQHADCYIPRFQKYAEVSKVERVSDFFYIVQNKIQKALKISDWAFAGQTTTAPDEFSSSLIFTSYRDPMLRDDSQMHPGTTSGHHMSQVGSQGSMGSLESKSHALLSAPPPPGAGPAHQLSGVAWYYTSLYHMYAQDHQQLQDLQQQQTPQHAHSVAARVVPTVSMPALSTRSPYPEVAMSPQNTRSQSVFQHSLPYPQHQSLDNRFPAYQMSMTRGVQQGVSIGGANLLEHHDLPQVMGRVVVP